MSRTLLTVKVLNRVTDEGVARFLVNMSFHKHKTAAEALLNIEITVSVSL